MISLSPTDSTRGAAPLRVAGFPAGHSHRRTSGGEAVPRELFLGDDETGRQIEK